jgi:hypothetical protein
MAKAAAVFGAGKTRFQMELEMRRRWRERGNKETGNKDGNQERQVRIAVAAKAAEGWC